MTFDDVTAYVDKRLRAQGLEDFVGAREVRARLFDRAADGLERGATGVDDREHPRIKGKLAKRDRPRDARAAKIALERG